MEIMNEEHPLKIRSARACVSAGFQLYLGNFRRIFRTTWLPALLCALVSALYSLTTISAMTQLMGALSKTAQGNIGENMAQYIIQSGVSLLDFIVTLVFVSYGFSMLSRHRAEGAIPYPARWVSLPDGRMLLRTIAVAIVWVVVTTIAGAIVMGIVVFGVLHQSYTTIGLGMLLLLVLAALLLPLVYPSMRYLSTRDTRLFDLLGPGFRQGFRYWGGIFAVLFVVLLIAVIILSITMLPATVLTVASMKSLAGVMMGDPQGMPSYMGWLSFLVFTLSGFIQSYVILATLFPAYYMAGSIEQQEIQRNEKTKNTLY